MPPLLRAAVGAQTRALDAADRLRKVPAAKVQGTRSKVTRELRNGMASVIEHVAIQPHSVADWKPLRGTPVAKSFLSEGKGASGLRAISASKMTPEQRNLWAAKVRNTASQRQQKKTLGPLKKPSWSAKRPPQAAEPFRNRSRGKREKARVESAYAENAARDAAPKVVTGRSPYVSPKPLKQAAVFGGVSVGAFGVARHDRRKDSAMSKADRNVRDAALGAAGGGTAALALHNAGGQGAKAALRLHRERNWDQKKHGDIWREHQRASGVSRAMSHDKDAQQKLYRHYPKGIPGWRGQRALAIESSSKPILAGLVTGGALLGAHHTTRQRPQPVSAVGKRVVEEQNNRRPTHAAAVAGGAGLVAWGVPRVKMLGEGLRIGARAAQDKQTRDFYRRAEGLRRAAVNGTQPVDRLGRIPGVGALGRKIPKGVRPAAAIVGGVGLIRAGIPVSEKTYAPVTSW